MQYKNTQYEIYEDGRCYNNITHQFLKPNYHKRYPSYHLIINNKQTTVAIHRMVAETFIERTDPLKIIVNHIDGNTKNFHKSNLEWVTAAENSKHACALGLITRNKLSADNFIVNEQWTEIKDFPNYLISTGGRVMNRRTKKILKSCISNNGYPEVNLWKQNTGYTKQIHQLVYTNFTQDFNLTNFVINHKDGCKTNNNLINLEKITYKENNLHAVYVIKTNHSIKPVQQLDENKQILQQFASIAQATRITHINNISRAIKTQRKAGGYYWEFINN